MEKMEKKSNLEKRKPKGGLVVCCLKTRRDSQAQLCTDLMLRKTLNRVEKRNHSDNGIHSEFSPGAMCTSPVCARRESVL